jgi:hypothetical protein
VTYGIFVTTKSFATIEGSSDNYVCGSEEEMLSFVEYCRKAYQERGPINVEITYEVKPLRPFIKK